jgi:MFS transporter, putative metabolite transport protein
MGSGKNPASSPQPKSVQEYIDETPVWADGTETSFNPLTAMQWRILGLATAGKFFEGMVVFMTGVALPLIVYEFGLGAAEKGIVGAATLFGILVGALALGGLADKFGRKTLFIIEMIIFTVFLILTSLSPTYHTLVLFLFGIGLALGCDYPTGHMIISESMPSGSRGKLVLGAFGFQAAGALVGTAVGYLILSNDETLTAWRWMYASAIIPAVLVILGRLTISESSHWLVNTGKVDHASEELARLLKRTPPYPKNLYIKTVQHENNNGEKEGSGYGALFSKKNLRATILASVPWFLQDLGTYGIGIFTPTILAATIGAQTIHPHNLATIIHNDILASEGAAFLDIFLIIGILFAIFLTDRVGRIKLQVIGFIGCAAGLFLASMSLNMDGGAKMILMAASLLGALVTKIFSIETKGMNLEELNR